MTLLSKSPTALSRPSLEERGERHYASILTRLTVPEMATVLPKLWRDVNDYLECTGSAPSGPPFVRYVVTDAGARIEVEAGVPVAEPVRGSNRVRAGVLPAGRYATVRHPGPLDELADINAALLEWLHENGYHVQSWPAEDEFVWRARYGNSSCRWAVACDRRTLARRDRSPHRVRLSCPRGLRACRKIPSPLPGAPPL